VIALPQPRSRAPPEARDGPRVARPSRRGPLAAAGPLVRRSLNGRRCGVPSQLGRTPRCHAGGRLRAGWSTLTGYTVGITCCCARSSSTSPVVVSPSGRCARWLPHTRAPRTSPPAATAGRPSGIPAVLVGSPPPQVSVPGPSAGLAPFFAWRDLPPKSNPGGRAPSWSSLHPMNAATRTVAGPPCTPCTTPTPTLWITQCASLQVNHQMAPLHAVVLSLAPLSERGWFLPAQSPLRDQWTALRAAHRHGKGFGRGAATRVGSGWR